MRHLYKAFMPLLNSGHMPVVYFGVFKIRDRLIQGDFKRAGEKIISLTGFLPVKDSLTFCPVMGYK